MLAALTTPIVSLTSSLDYSLFTYADVKEMTMRSIFEPKEDDSFFSCPFSSWKCTTKYANSSKHLEAPAEIRFYFIENTIFKLSKIIILLSLFYEITELDQIYLKFQKSFRFLVKTSKHRESYFLFVERCVAKP